MQLYALYAAVESGQCTDDFTAKIIMSRLYPTPQAFCLTLVLFVLYLVTSVVRKINKIKLYSLVFSRMFYTWTLTILQLNARIMCTKSSVEPVPQTVAAPGVAQVSNIELAPPLQSAHVVRSFKNARRVGVARNDVYGKVYTQEV